MQLAASIFKAYDIRGIVPSTLDEAVAEALGRAFGTIARQEGETTVAVGRDGRLSGPALCAALMRGLVAAGMRGDRRGHGDHAHAVLCRQHAVQQRHPGHGQPQPEGLQRLQDGDGAGAPFTATKSRPCARMMEDESWVLQDGGSVRSVDVLAAYRDRIVGDIKLARPMKIVVDSGNGIAGASAPAILRAIGCEVIELFSEVDGNFPNHHPDPSKPENLRDLMAALHDSDAELGLAFDGDGDRLGIVTQEGNNIYPDRQMMLFARDVLSRVPGGTIVFDVKCSQRLAPAIEAAGGVALMYKTGHSLIKAKMKEIDSPLGGEMSGHIFFKERWFGFDDGTYAGCRLLEIVSRSPDASAVLDACRPASPRPSSTCAAPRASRTGSPMRCRKWPRRRWPRRPRRRAAIRRWRTSTPSTACAWTGPTASVWCARSNTTPVLVLRFEGHTQEALHRIEADMLALLRSVKPDATIEAAAH